MSQSLQSKAESLSGWGRFRPVEQVTVSPTNTTQLQELIRSGQGPWIARGMGRSYGDPAVGSASTAILQGRLKGILAFDETSGLLRCEAGLTLGEIVTQWLPRGWFPAVVPGTQFVTVGGAIAGDVHGKNHHKRGTFARGLDSFRLLLADGTVHQCSRDENPELFHATTGGMGLTGVVLDATLRLDRRETAFARICNQRTGNLEETVSLMETLDESDYSVAWIDCLARGANLGRSVVSYGDDAATTDFPAATDPLTVPARRRLRVPLDFPNIALNQWSIRAFNALYYRLPRPAEGLQPLTGLHFPLDAIEHWNRIYGRRGFIQFQGLIPEAAGRECTRQLLEATAATGMASFLAVFKRTGAVGDGHLSFPDRGYTLAMDFPNVGNRLHELIDRLHRILLEAGGRVYLAKDALIDAESFRRMYPRLDEFREVRARVDPHARFRSNLSDRLGLT